MRTMHEDNEQAWSCWFVAPDKHTARSAVPSPPTNEIEHAVRHAQHHSSRASSWPMSPDLESRDGHELSPRRQEIALGKKVEVELAAIVLGADQPCKKRFWLTKLARHIHSCNADLLEVGSAATTLISSSRPG